MVKIGAVFARLAAAFVMFFTLQSAALAAPYHINDRVQAMYSSAWYNGTIIGIGEGTFAGDYYVKFDDYTNAYYVNEKNLRPLPEGKPMGPAGPSTRFTPADYECLYTGQYFYLRLGSDLTYQQTMPESDPGSYEIDDATGVIRFVTGPYAVSKWTAEVHNEADRAGVLLHADKDYECHAAR
jgi:hypothetical protein